VVLDQRDKEHPEPLPKDHRKFRTYFTRGVEAVLKPNLDSV